MEGPAIRDVGEALRVLQHVARYDAMRLETYREKENLADRIRVSPLGSGLALRFDDVGYFNRVYCPDADVFEKLPDIERFFSGGPFGCELVGPPTDSPDGSMISRQGWTPANSYAWMHTRDFRTLPPTQPTEFTICSPGPSERQQFLITYLRAFDAERDRFPAALRNMAHLFERPELDFLMAWHKGKPAGVGMTMRQGNTYLLCAGAALPEFRAMGCHAALLAARIRRAAESGCERICSWAVLGGQSHANLERAGLSVLGVTTAWRFSPQRGRLTVAPALFRSAHAEANGFSPRAGFRPFDPADAESTLGERFREVAVRSGAATAVVDGDARISYAELLQRAEVIAARLRSQCGAGGGVVAICLPSSLATIETILGALLGEFAWFCIDPLIPAQQRAGLVLAAAPVMLVDESTGAKGVREFASAVETHAAVKTQGPGGVAALYATSGSTGDPKLVALSHRAVLFDIGRQTNDLYLGSDDRFDSLSSFAFSSSLATTFGALLNGAELHCFNLRRNLTELPAWLGEHRITVSTMTVSMLRHILLLGRPATTFASMRLLSVGGEKLHRADVEAFRAGFPPSCVLQNAMAATETRTYAQYFVPRDGPVESPVPIGWPVAGKDVVLLDESGASVSGGSEGEIVVRSRYLADGYANDPQQTAMKFRSQPDGTVLYRTGDRGLFRDDGCLIFLGRTDSQVKIRGHRIELDHIAHVIGLHPRIAGSVAAGYSDPAGNNRLVAYVVARPNCLITETHLRGFLRDRLPEYALPLTIVFLPELPLNANFKVDRRRLPPPPLPTHEEGASAAGQTIGILRDIWMEVLQRVEISDDDSFDELGVDSLSTVRALVAIHQRLHCDLPSDSLRRFPTLRLLADCVNSTIGEDAIPDSVSIFQSGGIGCPFFLVAGLGGATSDYKYLAARIDSRHPVYGLNARSRFTATAGVSVESIAANHVAAIGRIAPAGGKLILVGHSLGGTIAFEIARQLWNRGFPGALPIVIDMPAINAAPRTTSQKLLDVLLNLPAWTAHEAAHLRLVGSPLRAYGNLRRVIRSLSGQAADDSFDPHIYFGKRSLPLAYQTFLTSMYQAMFAYVPGRYEGRMILLRTRIPNLTRRHDRAMGWHVVAAGGVRDYSIPGRHDDCMSEKHAPELASVLHQCAADFESGENASVSTPVGGNMDGWRQPAV